jgi:hypothetical protein
MSVDSRPRPRNGTKGVELSARDGILPASEKPINRRGGKPALAGPAAYSSTWRRSRSRRLARNARRRVTPAGRSRNATQAEHGTSNRCGRRLSAWSTKVIFLRRTWSWWSARHRGVTNCSGPCARQLPRANRRHVPPRTSVVDVFASSLQSAWPLGDGSRRTARVMRDIFSACCAGRQWPACHSRRPI